jgi:hypothetical protein
MKQTPIVAPAKRTEGSIIDDIALESGRLGAAQQEIAAFEDRRAAMLATESLDKIHALADSHARAKLGVEIAQSRLDALNRELAKFYETEERALLDAEMARLRQVDDEERQAVADYEAHARLIAADLSKLVELRDRRRQINTGLFSKGRTGAATYRGALISQVRLPAVGDGGDFWPRTSYGQMLDEMHARAARDAAALEEYHRGGR